MLPDGMLQRLPKVGQRDFDGGPVEKDLQAGAIH
jgi:hypothetical protein